MFKSFIRDLKRIISNDGGWVMAAAAAMAVMQSLSSKSAADKKMRMMVADAELQRRKLETARLSATEDYVANTQTVKQAAQKREIAIESNRLSAESNVATTFADSGIGGRSRSEIDDELDTTVSLNKYESRKKLDQELSSVTRDYTRTIEAAAQEADQINTTSQAASFGESAMEFGTNALSNYMTLGSAFGTGSKPATKDTDSFSVNRNRSIYDYNKPSSGMRVG